MEARNEITRLTLGARETMVLEDAADVEVICREGALWLTQYGDSRDIVLKPGQAFVLSQPTCVVMTALRGADFILRPVPRAAAPVPRAAGGWLRRLATLFDPRWSSAARRALEGRVRSHRVA